MLGCCQGLLSSNIDVAKAKISFSSVLVGIHLFAIDHLVLPEAPKRILPRTEYGTGPPSGSSFVGTVLQRSLRENAPPLLSYRRLPCSRQEASCRPPCTLLQGFDFATLRICSADLLLRTAPQPTN